MHQNFPLYVRTIRRTYFDDFRNEIGFFCLRLRDSNKSYANSLDNTLCERAKIEEGTSGRISVSLASCIPQACDLQHGLCPIKGGYA
mgnify:CR=1 FL=1